MTKRTGALIMPFYRFHILDFRRSRHVRLMTPEQRGYYRELMDECWLERSIPNNPVLLARLLGIADPETFANRDWPAILPCFYTRKDGTLGNRRIEHERAHARRLSQAGRDAGIASGRKRKEGKGLGANDRSTVVQRSSTNQNQNQNQRRREIQDSGEGPSAPPVDNSPGERDVSALLAGMGDGFGMEPIRAVRTPEDQRLAQAATKLIDRIRYLERDQNGDAFDPGGWWGRTRGPAMAKFEALAQLAKLLEAGKRPNSPHGYMTTTWAEKKANHYAARAEAESEKRRKEAGARA